MAQQTNPWRPDMTPQLPDAGGHDSTEASSGYKRRRLSNTGTNYHITSVEQTSDKRRGIFYGFDHSTLDLNVLQPSAASQGDLRTLPQPSNPNHFQNSRSLLTSDKEPAHDQRKNSLQEHVEPTDWNSLGGCGDIKKQNIAFPSSAIQSLQQFNISLDHPVSRQNTTQGTHISCANFAGYCTSQDIVTWTSDWTARSIPQVAHGPFSDAMLVEQHHLEHAYASTDALAPVRPQLSQDFYTDVRSSSTPRGLRAFDTKSPLPRVVDQPPSLEPQTCDTTDIICFGMITEIQGKYPRMPTSLPNFLPARLKSFRAFIVLEDITNEGTITADFSNILQSFLDEDALQGQVLCSFNNQTTNPKPKHVPNSEKWAPCSLDVILYGPEELADEIGDFLEQHDCYLQTPINCDRNVPYRNPHTFAFQNPPPYIMTFELNPLAHQCQLEEMPSQADLLDALTTDEELKESEQPQMIQTQLEKHQKQALTLLLRRESGWVMDYSVPDVWGSHNSNVAFFVNRISNTQQYDEPKDFRGGILADPMGLGKTLTMISPIAKDLEANVQLPSFVQSTLVIVPPSLLTTWEEQLEEHIVAGALSHYRHHGKSRLTSDFDFSRPGIVLTTYQTVSSEWKNSLAAQPSLLMTTHWRRIILDEAHCIRNPSSQMTKAICSLDATSRWAVTGTPIQNRLTDLESLLSFLRVDPYDKRAAFETDIVALWRQGNPEEALDRLKRLMRCLLLRRAKSTIHVPLRTDLKCPLNFRLEERELYEATHQLAVRQIAEALLQVSGSSTTYLNALQQIDALRRICNVGCFYKSSSNESKGVSPTHDWESDAQRSFNYLLEFGEAVCHFCTMTIDIAAWQSSRDQQNSQIQMFSCLRIMCSECVQKASTASVKLCGHTLPCQVANFRPGDKGGKLLAFAASPSSQQPLPTKVQALISQPKTLETASKGLWLYLSTS